MLIQTFVNQQVGFHGGTLRVKLQTNWTFVLEWTCKKVPCLDNGLISTQITLTTYI